MQRERTENWWAGCRRRRFWRRKEEQTPLPSFPHLRAKKKIWLACLLGADDAALVCPGNKVLLPLSSSCLPQSSAVGPQCRTFRRRGRRISLKDFVFLQFFPLGKKSNGSLAVDEAGSLYMKRFEIFGISPPSFFLRGGWGEIIGGGFFPPSLAPFSPPLSLPLPLPSPVLIF